VFCAIASFVDHMELENSCPACVSKSSLRKAKTNNETRKLIVASKFDGLS
jgi:hypothetical protein